jgi:hypothetical protein
MATAKSTTSTTHLTIAVAVATVETVANQVHA